ncbi:MAG TPA: hypothetical protein VE978_05000 [Chitinophagales bacterium]|nr:hypothetical protein [Chitinophagales bacterium]
MKNFFPVIFFSFTFVLGILLFDDYGISWDEPIQRDLGMANWNYVLHGDDSLFHLINKYHGPFVEMIEAAPEKIFHLQDEKTIFLSRHLINYLIFWLGSIFLFLSGREMGFESGAMNYEERADRTTQNARRTAYNSQLLPLLAVVMVYLTPRIFAQSFYNSKDIPLLSFFIINIFFLFRFLKKPSFKLAIVFAIVSGMLYTIRVLAVIIPALAILFFLLNLLNGNLSKRSLKFLLTYIILFVLFAIAFYPVMWHDPVDEIQKSFSTFSHYQFYDVQFFLGKLIKPQQLPWYYIPVWMGITIPILWQLFFLAGLVFVVIMVIRTIKNFFRDSWQWLVIAAWLFVPWLMVLLLHSTVYDEWRHLFFIYPAFILIAVAGVKMLIDKLNNTRGNFIQVLLRVSCLVLFTAQSFFVLTFSLKNHPYEYSYFNSLAGKNPQQKFDLDYWGLSYRQALEYLVQNAKEESIKVCWHNSPGYYNLAWLPARERNRIHEVHFDSADYFLTNFRFYPEQYTDTAWHTVRVNNFTILAIEKLHSKNH